MIGNRQKRGEFVRIGIFEGVHEALEWESLLLLLRERNHSHSMIQICY